MKKIYYLWLRQIKKYLRSRSRMLGSFFQPLLYLVAMGYGFGSVFSQAGQGSYLDFLAPGVIGMSIIFTSMFSGMEVLWDRQFGFLKETLVAPMPRFNIMLGRTLGSATVATVQGIIVMLMSFVLVTHLMSWLSILQAIGVMFLIATLFTSLSTMIASLLKDMQGFQAIMNFLIMPLFMLSGSLFPLQGLPDLLSLITRIDPLSYGIDALRALFLNTSHFGLMLDVGVLGATSLLFLWLGGYFFKKIQV